VFFYCASYIQKVARKLRSTFYNHHRPVWTWIEKTHIGVAATVLKIESQKVALLQQSINVTAPEIDEDCFFSNLFYHISKKWIPFKSFE
jgi:hypothetical protein